MSDSPSIIRQESQHSVTVTEGSLVATSKPSDPHSPQVRQTLPGEDPAVAPEAESAQVLAPAIAGASAKPSVVFERSVSEPSPAHPDVAPAIAPPAPSDAPVFERSLQDGVAQTALPAALAPSDDDGDSAVDRFLRERRLALPAEPAQAPSDQDGGPVLERSLSDHRIALPEPLSRSDPASDGPVFERSLQEHRVDLPGQRPAPAVPSEGPVFERALEDRLLPLPQTPPAFSPATAVVQTAPREGSSPEPVAPRKGPAAPEPVALAQAQQIIAETAREVHSRVEEAIGPADAQWVEMDFPARVVKLKIENDKVRAKLDELEDMADRQAR